MLVRLNVALHLLPSHHCSHQHPRDIIHNIQRDNAPATTLTTYYVPWCISFNKIAELCTGLTYQLHGCQIWPQIWPDWHQIETNPIIFKIIFLFWPKIKKKLKFDYRLIIIKLKGLHKKVLYSLEADRLR